MNQWRKFQQGFVFDTSLGMAVDFSRAGVDRDFLEEMSVAMGRCYDELAELEAGAIANPDENRQVGHYWLRAPALAASPEMTQEIEQTLKGMEDFVQAVHAGRIQGQRGHSFKYVLLIGIGGSSLGPQFVADALGYPNQPLKAYFINNTDPDGIDRVLDEVAGYLDQTLVVVISKSGGTVETRNGMIEVRGAYAERGLDFAKHAVAVTQVGSMLDEVRKQEAWLAAFPMWDWVGGRTSLLSAVGLLPLGLLGVDVQQLLEGARLCDVWTRERVTENNPSALLALSWYKATGGQGGGQMVVLPYKDRLELVGKYLQQLVMESLGKELDRDGRRVHQGLTVLGNKGSTDQHSYVQQLLDGPNNFVAVFIEVLLDRAGSSAVMAEESTAGDYLQAFRLGTREALSQRGRSSLTILLEKVDALRVGALIALFERAVTFYASLVNINAYHQPAVELGKRSAGEIIGLKNDVVHYLKDHAHEDFSVEELVKALGCEGAEEMVFSLLWRLSYNAQSGICVVKGAAVSGEEASAQDEIAHNTDAPGDIWARRYRCVREL
ncbi:MAG: glucose-6-phosphate isomerase [Peptococcaceae bacterium]|nr:glucose-6-phosphate isomerase [Peptococcaceae bacterium]